MSHNAFNARVVLSERHLIVLFANEASKEYEIYKFPYSAADQTMELPMVEGVGRDIADAMQETMLDLMMPAAAARREEPDHG